MSLLLLPFAFSQRNPMASKRACLGREWRHTAVQGVRVRVPALSEHWVLERTWTPFLPEDIACARSPRPRPAFLAFHLSC